MAIVGAGELNLIARRTLRSIGRRGRLVQSVARRAPEGDRIVEFDKCRPIHIPRAGLEGQLGIKWPLEGRRVTKGA